MCFDTDGFIGCGVGGSNTGLVIASSSLNSWWFLFWILDFYFYLGFCCYDVKLVILLLLQAWIHAWICLALEFLLLYELVFLGFGWYSLFLVSTPRYLQSSFCLKRNNLTYVLFFIHFEFFSSWYRLYIECLVLFNTVAKYVYL